jgi:adenylyl-sulfate kinase
MDKGFTLWFTGLSGAGKTTVSQIVADKLRDRGHKVELLDGDIIRTNLSKGLGFSKEDRDTNIRRIGFVCDLLSRNGVVAIAAAISPYEAVRRENREMIGNYVEVFVDCDLDTLIERDVKGLYKKALAGEIKNFTGIDDPYEAPEDAEIQIHSNNETVDESVDIVIRRLEDLGYTDSQPDDGYSEDEEAAVAERLEALGYID